jgi:molybdate transport system permease protein
MTSEEWQIVWFTAWVSALSTLVILPFGLALAWVLARRDWPGKSIVETLVSLPLVMPPVATGLILLKLFGTARAIGGFLHDKFNLDIIFTWRAVLLALSVMSLPLLVRSARTAFEEVNPRLEQIARTLGAGDWRVFFTITVPLASRGIVGGMLLAFARALGEFGATIMVAGNIPGKTSDNLARHFSGRATRRRRARSTACSACRSCSPSPPCGAVNFSCAARRRNEPPAEKHFAAAGGLHA